ncbi:MAG: redoxin domain-containing protein [Maribacter sp.]|nr:redoxin domain-containing protein [Maribacter sp.]
MKNYLFALLALMAFAIQAQHTISGNFSPAKDYKWLIAYHINPGTQAYVSDTKLDDGKFTLTLPATSIPGIYRLVYGIPETEFYFDVLYDGQEDIQLSFDTKNGVSYKVSEENKIFNAYLREINGAKQGFMDFYAAGKTDAASYKKLAVTLNQIQTSYEEGSKGMLVQNLIKTNRPYIPENFESNASYWQHKKDDYFKHIDLKDPLLQASSFVTDKLINYVFMPTSAEKQPKESTEKIQIQNSRILNEQLQGSDLAYQLHLYQILWNKAVTFEYNGTADFIFNSYIQPLAKATNNEKAIDEITNHNRLRIGAKAPGITWHEGAITKKLSDLEGGDCYVLIFWSSTCSHCLNELPKLHKKLMAFPQVKVLAVGLEDDDSTWKVESAKLNGFEHAMALGKWENEYVKLYDVHQTPTYYILDKDKRIIDKPQTQEEVIKFLSN